jgi:RNA polymerase sigma factor (sigma-70 family)
MRCTLTAGNADDGFEGFEALRVLWHIQTGLWNSRHTLRLHFDRATRRLLRRAVMQLLRAGRLQCVNGLLRITSRGKQTLDELASAASPLQAQRAPLKVKLISDLYRSDGNRIVKALTQKFGNQCDPEDVLQEAFLIFLRKIDHLPIFGSRASPRGYLYMTAINIVRARLRQQRNRPLFVPFPESGEPESRAMIAADSPEAILEICCCIDACLSEKLREVLLARITGNGKTNAQLAEELGIHPDAFDQRLSRARKLLEQELRRRGWDFNQKRPDSSAQ